MSRPAAVKQGQQQQKPEKNHKYNDIISGVDFVPVAIEMSRVWGDCAMGLIKEVGRRIAAVTHDKRSTMFLRQRLSVAVQRGNAFFVLGTLPRLYSRTATLHNTY